MDPKVAVGTIIRAVDDRLVLVRRAIEPGYGLWVFPGGYVDRGEVITAAALREAKEESGLDVRLDGLINIYSYPGRAPIIVVYAATMLGGELCGDDECLEARLFTPAEIPGTGSPSAARPKRSAITSTATGTIASPPDARRGGIMAFPPQTDVRPPSGR